MCFCAPQARRGDSARIYNDPSQSLKERKNIMKKMHGVVLVVNFIFAVSLAAPAFAQDPSFYVKKDTWQETMRASRESLMAEEKA